MHCIRYNQVLQLAANDVIVLSLLVSALSDISLQIWKGRRSLYTHVAFTFRIYLELFRSYSNLFIWLGFQRM